MQQKNIQKFQGYINKTTTIYGSFTNKLLLGVPYGA
jgi:hypothetical protein